MDFKEVAKLIKNGYIRKQKHPEFPLYIYNYTQKCQFERMWTPETMSCRGLIVDEDNKIVARPFPKFFNLSELESVDLTLPKENFSVFEKYDGSLGISYWWEGKVYLATRGSFTSDQAIVGTKMLHEAMKESDIKLSEQYTYLFEIIYPENRIVVDYGDEKKLVLLAVQTVSDDIDAGYMNPDEGVGSIEGAKKINIHNLDEIQKMAEPNKEGFVIVYDSGFRVKVKFDEYVRLHRIVTGINSRRVWEVLRNGDSLNEFLQNVPEEFEKWITSTRDELIGKKLDLENRAIAVVTDFREREITDRKEIALEVMEHHKDISRLVFGLLDEKDISPMAWAMIKPEVTDPFKVEI